MLLLCSIVTGLPAQQPEATTRQQRPPPATAVQEREESGLIGVQLIGGVTTFTNAPHAVVGGFLNIGRGQWTVLGVGMLGTGSDYDSRVFSAALGRRLKSAGRLTLAVFAGYGEYREVGLSEIERAASGPWLGGVVTVDIHPFVGSVMLSDLFGRYDDSDVSDPFRFHVPRLVFGIGF